ncbi:MAG: hypothetical protein WBP29_10815, partial [Candidatus Zixiibacteriota bacterium]
QWSPSGKLIGAWRGDTLVVFDVQARKELKSIPVRRPKFCYWISEDSLALSYQDETAASKAIDRWPIITRSIITAQGGVDTILCDTVYDSRNSLTHWRQLPTNKVGVFRNENGRRTKFYSLQQGTLAETLVDTLDMTNCWESAPAGATQYFPSPSCSLAVSYSEEDNVEVLGRDGSLIRLVVARGTPLPEGKIAITGRPRWSYDEKYICFRTVIEDEHSQEASELFIFEIESGNKIPLVSFKGPFVPDYEWSFDRNWLIVSDPLEGRLLLWQF